MIELGETSPCLVCDGDFGPRFHSEGVMEGYFVLIAIAGAGWILFS